MALELVRADYARAAHAEAIVALLDAYARDLAGGGEPLPQAVRAQLVAGLASQQGAFSLLAFVDGKPVGLANCFFGYSTFAAKPLVNLHDIVVLPESRGQGVAKALLAEVEMIAAAAGACKVTLEVLSGNGPAKALYASLGYGDYALDPAMGTAQFWQKRLAA
jgi:ribosomal protein S18 acetylase RimI-like enzyme